MQNIIDIMLNEGKRRNAPVFRINKIVGSDKFKILVFVVLSSRTKDIQTIMSVKRLFSKFPNPKSMTKANVDVIKKLIKGVGFYKQKAKRLIKIAEYVDKNGVPKTREELIKLPGVGRKTANVVLAWAFKKNVIGVDVHVHRIANRLGLINTNNVEKTEKELEALFKNRKKINIAFVGFGQTVCKAKPLCKECPLKHICKYYRNNERGKKKEKKVFSN